MGTLGRCRCVPDGHTSYPIVSEVLRLGRREEREAQEERGIGFEDIVFHIERGDLLDILEHPNPERDGGQRIFVVRREA